MLTLFSLVIFAICNGYAAEAVGIISLRDVDPSTVDYKNATTVLLKNISMEEIPKNYFYDLGLDLVLLRITNSRLVKINEEAFDGLNHLNLLELSNDGIDYIEPKTFTRLKGLELLQLKSNKLRKVSLVLNNVQEIVLAHNAIQDLEEDFIVGKSVAFIDLRFNKLKHLKNSMKHLIKLATIYLSNNEITDIEPEVFADNENLVRVYASGNRLKSVRGLNLNQLMTLDLSGNLLETLDNSSFAGMSLLDDLQLSHNRISELGNAFDDAKGLKFLDLSDNFIKAINPDLFKNNQYLSKLRLSNNNIRILEPFRSNFHHLKWLDLSHNQLESMDDKFFNSMQRLEVLDLSYNKLLKIGKLLHPLVDLVSLDLSSNNLALDEDTVGRNERLTRLNASGNGLDMKLSYLGKNRQLTYLDLSGNRITKFCDVEFQMDYVTSIDLSRNQIQDLNCFKNSNLLPFCQLNIAQNPLTCDSDLDDVVAHFALMRCSPSGSQAFTAHHIESDSDNLKTALDQWNAVKRGLCPKGFDIHITKVEGSAKGDADDEQTDVDYEHYHWDNDYYENVESSSSDGAEETHLDKNSVHLDIEVDIEDSADINEHGESEIIGEQSAKASWENIDKFKNIIEDVEDDMAGTPFASKAKLSLFTISLIFIGISLLLVLANVAIFIFIRVKGWKRDFRGQQKYTHLDNGVYKSTTVRNEPAGNETGSEKENYKINCSKMFYNFGLKVHEGDNESVKMIVENGAKAEV